MSCEIRDTRSRAAMPTRRFRRRASFPCPITNHGIVQPPAFAGLEALALAVPVGNGAEQAGHIVAAREAWASIGTGDLVARFIDPLE